MSSEGHGQLLVCRYKECSACSGVVRSGVVLYQVFCFVSYTGAHISTGSSSLELLCSLGVLQVSSVVPWVLMVCVGLLCVVMSCCKSAAAYLLQQGRPCVCTARLIFSRSRVEVVSTYHVVFI
jgi:hypothetical protein